MRLEADDLYAETLRRSMVMKPFYWIGGIVLLVGWLGMVANAHQHGMSICLPFSARTGPMGLIGCVDSYNMRQGICVPMSANDGPLGLIACELDEEEPVQQQQ